MLFVKIKIIIILYTYYVDLIKNFNFINKKKNRQEINLFVYNNVTYLNQIIWFILTIDYIK